MKAKRKIPTAAEIAAQGVVVLTIHLLDPSDPSLPPPAGMQFDKKKPVDPREKQKLADTKAAGGLLPQRS
jgi:hypothetical protein